MLQVFDQWLLLYTVTNITEESIKENMDMIESNYKDNSKDLVSFWLLKMNQHTSFFGRFFFRILLLSILGCLYSTFLFSLFNNEPLFLVR